jgi:Membrane proteins related to metalloendopeptidases
MMSSCRDKGLLLSCLLLALLLSACSSSVERTPAPVREASARAKSVASVQKKTPAPPQKHADPVQNKAVPTTYTVKAGDTLYAIAWLYGLDFSSLARYNRINSPYHIHSGQVIKLDLDDPTSGRYVVKRGDSLGILARNFGVPAHSLVQLNNLKKPYTIHPGQLLYLGTQVRAVAQGSDGIRDQDPEPTQNASSTVVKKIESPSGKAYARTQAEHNYNKSLTWRWPAKGRVIQGFSLAEQGNKGVDISGRRGQPVIAAASGKVVYAGSALRGYGNLIIIKHDDDYLSAYAHNETLLVKEQQDVKAGQRIANMGSSDAEDVRLHFEIRYRGQSVNPMRFLPKR